MSELIITEKPSVSQKIAAVLGKPKVHRVGKVSYYEVNHKGKRINVACAVGHLFSVTEKEKKGWTYPVFEIKWEESSKINKESAYTKQYLDVIRKLAKESDSFTVACDWDIEGEVIGERILYFSTGRDAGCRMHFSTTTPEDLLKAYEEKSKSIDKGLAEAGITRHELDYLYGINLSRALTLSVRHSSGRFRILSSGRVQGPALKILYDKEKEIGKFVPKPYWEIFLEGAVRGKKIEASHAQDKFWEKKIVDRIYANVKNGKKGVIKAVERKETSQKCPLPFDLTSLQSEAYGVLGIKPKKTLEIAQELYTNSYISYPRTSSQKLPPSINCKKILSGLSAGFGKECRMLLAKKTLKPREGNKIDKAHPAIYPTGILPRKIFGSELKLYQLIVHRFFSVFGDDAIRETVTLSIDVNGEDFVCRGTRTKMPGWHELYNGFLRLDEEELPNASKEDAVNVKKIELLSKETQPPKRYTEASIIKELESRGLGTKATRSVIVDNLFQRGYVDGSSIAVSEIGLKTVDVLKKYCPDILDEKLTREFEDEMEKITEGKSSHDRVISNARKILSKILDEFKKNELQIGKGLNEAMVKTMQRESLVGKCECGGELHIRRGKFGYFIGCTNYEDGCKTIYKLPRGIGFKISDKECSICGFPQVLIIRSGSHPVLFCINPKCSKKKEEEKELSELHKKCPKCGKELVVRSGAYGAFLACPGFPKCRYIENLKK